MPFAVPAASDAPDAPAALPLVVLDPEALPGWLEAAAPETRAWVEGAGFAAALGETLALPGPSGAPGGALFGWGTEAARSRGRFHLAAAAGKLPPGTWALEGAAAPGLDPEVEALGWLLEAYRFDRYKARKSAAALLVAPPGVDAARLELVAAALARSQDLINTPARDLGPVALEAAFRDLAARHGAEARAIRGEALVAAGLPMIHAVGAAAAEAPRLLDLSWGREDAPRVTLVGKGVTFDTGGLDIKPPASMALMKKDMGGAAAAMALADMVMGLGLDLRLRLLVPCAENAISAPALRPGDVLTSRKGLTVEVNNTDAEGRLILADALALADEEAPELVVSLATLTGAARVALGPDLPPFFTRDDGIAAALAAAAERVADPLWRLPLWPPYEPLIEPAIADLDNAPAGGMAGAITAALFLGRFVTTARSYVHLDIYGWVPKAAPGRPQGGACQAVRALLALLEERICSRT